MSYQAIRDRLSKADLVILDGAIGTEILRRGLSWEGHQVDTRPEAIRTIHEDYIQAGADIITTNTFQLSRRSFLNHFKDLEHMRRIGAPGLEGRARDLIRAAVELAVEARRNAAGERPVAIAGSITTLEWCFRPDLVPSYQALKAEHREIVEDMARAGADLILFETFNNSTEARAGVEAAGEVGIPAWVGFVPDWKGHLLGGEEFATAVRALQSARPEAILLNCAPPEDCTRALEELARVSEVPTGVYPHIGRFDPPEWMFTEEYPPERYTEVARGWVKLGARIVGGCCGTTPDHIRLLRQTLAA